jgi:lipopolysaccharide transport system ATP-binding protein
MSQPAVSCDRVGKRYRLYDSPRDRLLDGLVTTRAFVRRAESRSRDVWAIRDVSLDLAAGETLGIVGANGSGKSTLLQIIAGTVTPSEGQVTVHGRVAALLELGAGFSPDFSGVDNVRLNAAVWGLSPSDIEDRLDAILAFADIGRHADLPVRTYSSGMFLRLAFAVAIHVDPDILIIDEALAVGDIAFQAKCIARIRRLQADGKTLLFVSHDLGAVRALCHRALYLERGCSRGLGPAPTVVDTFIRDIQGEPSPRATAGAAGGAALDAPMSRSLAARFAAFDATCGERHGTGDARIRLVELVDDHDQPVSTCEFDAPVRIRIWVEGVTSCLVSVNYKCRDRHLVAVVGADFLIADHALLALEPGRLHVVEYRTRLALKDGDYTVRASVTVPIARHDQAVFVDVVEITSPFTVLPAAQGRIYTQAYLPNSVSVRDITEGDRWHESSLLES